MGTPTKRRRRPPAVTEEVESEVEEAPEATDDGDDDTEPTGSKPVIRSGWSGTQQMFDETSPYAQAFKLEEQSKFVAFLEETPYAGFARHWVERVIVTDGKRRKVNRPYICPASVKVGECPICKVGDRPQAVSSFNVAEIGDDGVAVHKSWDVGQKIYKILRGYHDDKKIGPLTRGFYLCSRSGTGGTTNYSINPVRPSSMQDEYDVTPPAQADLDALPRYTSDILEIPKRKELREIAAELSGYDDDDESWA